MTWPQYTKPGESVSAAQMLQEIAMICTQRLPTAPPTLAPMYTQLGMCSVAELGQQHHHGVDRWTSAPDVFEMYWVHVSTARSLVGKAQPTPQDLASAIEAIDHTGAGGGNKGGGRNSPEKGGPKRRRGSA